MSGRTPRTAFNTFYDNEEYGTTYNGATVEVHGNGLLKALRLYGQVTFGEITGAGNQSFSTQIFQFPDWTTWGTARDEAFRAVFFFSRARMTPSGSNITADTPRYGLTYSDNTGTATTLSDALYERTGVCSGAWFTNNTTANTLESNQRTIWLSIADAWAGQDDGITMDYDFRFPYFDSDFSDWTP